MWIHLVRRWVSQMKRTINNNTVNWEMRIVDRLSGHFWFILRSSTKRDFKHNFRMKLPKILNFLQLHSIAAPSIFNWGKKLCLEVWSISISSTYWCWFTNPNCGTLYKRNIIFITKKRRRKKHLTGFMPKSTSVQTWKWQPVQ